MKWGRGGGCGGRAMGSKVGEIRGLEGCVWWWWGGGSDGVLKVTGAKRGARGTSRGGPGVWGLQARGVFVCPCVSMKGVVRRQARGED